MVYQGCHPCQELCPAIHWVMLEGQERIGILLVYGSPCYPSISLPELSGLISDVLLEPPSPIYWCGKLQYAQ